MRRVLTIPSIIVHPLRVQNIVHSHHVIVFTQCTTPHTSKFLHMSANTEYKTKMNT